MAVGSETEEFATLLRKLKERSGRSYGVLAGKLHMSTSTVHRYCNGDAVPAEYAPVERFARLCSATPDELMDLHRRWLLADAARRRPKDTAVPQAAAPEAAVPETVVPDAAVREAVLADAMVPEAVVPDALESDVQAANVLASGVLPSDVLPSDVLASDIQASDVIASGLPASGPDRGRRPGRRNTRLWLIGAAVVAVVAVAVPVALALRPDGTSGTGSDTVALPAAPSGESPSVSPSPRPSGSLSPSPSPSRSVSSGGTAARPSSTTGDLGADGDSIPAVPLSVNVRPYIWDNPCSQSYLIDRSASKVPPPPAEQDAKGWANVLGAVSAGGARIELSVQGKSTDAVVLQALHVRMVGRHAPLGWASYAMGNGCGGEMTPAAFDVNLDAGTPVSRAVAGVQGDQKIPATDFPYRVSSTDPQVLEINAHTTAHDVSWYLELQWSSGNRHGTVRIDDNGKPFRASGAPGQPQYIYPPGSDAWQPAAPQ
ncbi:helix-turn-helix transcriptional regulator [Streptomyces sp. NBC_01500]|uniref:helix-turn-helix domain-containing protein n=1 Tax=Streptomyces sp. NBC_01500 TaxID=2903886 RepID=UPI002B1CC042|nr:helix-turn-helix transcriptional regulator [Streptomyces sp. NBC_01500]